MSPAAIELSSRYTFFTKIVFPILWIGGFGAGSMALWASNNAPSQIKWTFLAVWAVGSLSIRWSSVRLKRVRVDGKTFYVSNYRKEIALPLGSVERVSENRWINIHPVTLYLRRPTDFGSKIMFMPKMKMFLLWRSHPVVAEIKHMVALAQTEGGA